MPKTEIDKFLLPQSVRIGLWKMTETETELCAKDVSLNELAKSLSGIKSQSRRLEVLSVRQLLAEMLGYIPDVQHNEDGKPYLVTKSLAMNLSISHTKGYAAVILSEKCNVAIDIEYRSERVCRIADRFLREDERPFTTEGKLLCWCAKETLYKLHSSDKLTFSEMRTCRLPQPNGPFRGTFLIENLRRKQKITVYYVITADFVLTYALETAEKM